MADEDNGSFNMDKDARVLYLKHRILSCFPKLQGPKFDKLFITEDNKGKVQEFLEVDDKRFLLIPESLKLETMMPNRLSKQKYLLLMKLVPDIVPLKGFEEAFAALEITGPSAFEHLELLASEIFLPVLSNQDNQAKWGETATREIMDRFYTFLSGITILCGQIKGQTMLPMPPVDLSTPAVNSGASSFSESKKAIAGKNRISLLEGAIITWTKQIRNVLKQDSESLLKQGLHPTPDVEIEFWDTKAKNLNSIFDQLQSPRIRKVLRALDQSRSTYCTTFARLCKDVFTARIEANDNTKYLRTLSKWFEKLNSDDDFPSLKKNFKPILHIILLIWKNSKHYNTPSRLVVLMREICNSLINQAQKYISGDQIFDLIEKEEAGIAVDQLRTTLAVCSAFKSTYFAYRATASAECPTNRWNITNNALFMRLDSFLERCNEILDLTQTIVQFSKLAKVDVGGTKGKTLTASVRQIHDDFQNSVNTFRKLKYDIMDVSAKEFEDDYFNFKSEIKELERRLGAVISLAFDDCPTVYGRFKLLDSFDGLLERPIIQDELEKKYVALVQSYGADLKVVQEAFLQFRGENTPIPNNYPPISGALTWCRGLIERIEIPMQKLILLDRTILDREETKEVFKVYESIRHSLREYEQQKSEEWANNVEASSQQKLKLHLVCRNPETNLISVNFDAALIRLLREVKYFKSLGIDIPQSAETLYQDVDTFRKWTGSLELISYKNNSNLVQLNETELPLVRPYLDKFDAVIEEGISSLNWLNKESIDTFIENSNEKVNTVDDIVKTMKTNLSKVTNALDVWNNPLMERKPKPIDKDEFDRLQKALKSDRYAKVKDGSKDIKGFLNETNKVLKVSNASENWKGYQDYVSNIIVQGLAKVIKTSLSYFEDEIDLVSIAKYEKLPILEIKLNLIGEDVKFQPDLYGGNGKGVRDVVNSTIGGFFNFSTFVKRLDSEGNYLREMHTDPEICMLLAGINEKLQENEDACLKLKATYEEYSYLWTTNLEDYFAEFCEDAQIITPLGQKIIDLDKFDQEITKYEQIQSTVKKMVSPLDIGWLRINILPIKQALLMNVGRWIMKFSNHIKETIHNKLVDMNTFVHEIERGLSVKIPEENGKEKLMEVIQAIAEVRKASDLTAELWKPFESMVVQMKKHSIDFSDITINELDLQSFLEEAPMNWEQVQKMTFKIKEEILPLQIAEVDNLKKEFVEFYDGMRVFRNKFNKIINQKIETSSEAYQIIDEQLLTLADYEVQVVKNNRLEELFELQVSKYQETADTRRDLKMMKFVWDMKTLISHLYYSWKQQLWSDIDTEKLVDQNKEILKSLRKYSSENQIVKGWKVYQGMEEDIQRMNIILPLIDELHSPAMRDRHWDRMAAMCGVESVDPANPKFTFNDMVKLDIHLQKELIEDLVSGAQKELKIETQLGVIINAWNQLEMDYVPHKDTEMMIIRPSEDVMESLEAHQMELQAMVSVEFFKDKVIEWQVTLGEVEEAIKVWTLVSRSWASLESIFLASADIRSQLPDDTKRFEGIDSEFKEMMKEAVNIPNVVEVCTAEGRIDSLKSMIDRLNMCQKSLNEYLDMKKKIFPRFYFVSNVALLDMLANGTNPPKIMPYLGDCYDSLANLRFVNNADGSKSTKSVDLMIAKDGEQIPLDDTFTMEGEVEGYLNLLTEAMIRTLRKSLEAGYETAMNWEVEKPRHEWLFQYPAQVVLTGTQIYWTEEAERSLEEYEGGQEDAVKKYIQVCNSRLASLIELVLKDLLPSDRCKIISLITLDVHARDVVQKLIDEKTESPAAFLWQQQLRFYWVPSLLDVDVKICDFRCKYFYEWIGNTGRLVITPLTDRCYITLTMGLRLFLGGAPAGPAGTGKTETTKDLARALAIPCYVFNCSDQMNYQTMADIFRGLAQTGGWGCFDEFNRIPIEVLSVIATQVKTVQDAMVYLSVPSNREPEYQHLPAGTPPVKVGYFEFMGDTVYLVPSCGFFITMNPGYAGRTELPENLKVLFRSCAMIRPDLKPICENMLMSEGFQTARVLAIKFVTLYQLASELLSKQFHYDWGLRAVKSVLRVAGMLKRGEPHLDEAQILMRALRDFNTPKIPALDTPIFLRLIADLFMGLHVEPKVNENLKAKIVEAATNAKLQADELFVLKVAQFQELLDVRHSVMLLGPTGCAKTTIWKTLAGAHNLGKEAKAHTCIYETVNPKSVSGDELYGYMTLAKDWKDGVLSIIMRGMSKNFADQGFHEYQTYKWVVLDGDIDAVWIESMNTVMDDNKVLTLVSNERVPLSAAMRMVFEINSLKNASPATVSRAGILFINEADVGWRPFMETWLAARPDPQEKEYIPGFFDKYIEGLVEMTRKGFKEVTPIRLLNKISTIIYIFEALLDPLSEEEKQVEKMEMYFQFACVWAFGGPMIIDKQGDHRKNFSDQFSALFGQKFPKEGLVFDYFFDIESGEFLPWTEKVKKYQPIPIGGGPGETSFSQLSVPTVDTTRVSFITDLLVRRGKYVMLVGGAGTGKTSIFMDYLRNLDKDVDKILSTVINMSYFTDSAKIQSEIEIAIDKRSGRKFGPPQGKRMVYFIDDMNLPYIETYGTQNSIALLTQHMCYGDWFDRADLGLRKEIVDCQYIAAMNPTSGSFEICERAQRHFATFSALMPSASDLKTIYHSILAGHLMGFAPKLEEMAEKLVEATIDLHFKVFYKFLPSAIKFTYNWNMRELRNVFQGVCLSRSDYYSAPKDILRLWVHECERVYQDRLLSEPEQETFSEIFAGVTKAYFPTEMEAIWQRPIIYTKFVTSNDGSYLCVPDMEKLKSVLENKLIEYNESNAMMDLVLFDQAMEHITRICRIISNPSGNAMLIGVGGSGKQSLSKLSAYICQMEVKQLQVTSRFKVDDLKEALKEMFKIAGCKGIPLMFILTDSQIINERFLIYINAILSSGWISDLFPKDEMEGLLSGVRNEAKSQGIPDLPDALLAFLITRIQTNLHLVLCFSPVGELFRVRARRFPALINCTIIDFFHPWPRDALINVSSRFLEEVEADDSVKTALSVHMAEEHLSVMQASVDYLVQQRRYNYVTPKSYLELIGFYKYLLNLKRNDATRLIDRLDVGLSTLRKTATDVSELKIDLERTMVKVEEKKKATDELIVEMGIQRADAEIQQAAAQIESEKAEKAAGEAAIIEEEAAGELAQAEPAMKAAAGAVDCLSKAMLTELKNLKSPPAGVDKVTACCLIMIKQEYKNHSWNNAKNMMANVDQFKSTLAAYDGKTIPDEVIKKLEPFCTDPDFTPQFMLSKSAAAANLCEWVVNIYKFNRIYVKVKPLMDTLDAARAAKAAADASLQGALDIVASVEAKLAELEQLYINATAEKQAVEEMAQKCLDKLGLAERLVGGLASENERWGIEITKLQENALTLVGDCMLAAGFVSYLGAFDQEIRLKLWMNTWAPDIAGRSIPLTVGVDPLNMLTNDGNNARMIKEGLPADRISIESGSIIVNCKRWPLLIDPQIQGIKWLKEKEKDNGLKVLQLTQKNWNKKIEQALSNGETVIIENLGEDIDATLEPVISRAVYKRGRNLFLRFGGEEVEYDAGFQLYLQTKLANPHYKPEIAAQCTLINFIATEKGLEDQLLSKVVSVERPELEAKSQELTAAFQRYKIELVQLEDELLERLANAPEDILSDIPLIEGLEATKKAALEINAAVEEGKKTEVAINLARESYRKQATEGAMLYFLLTQLYFIDHMYQYSLDSFVYFFFKSIERAPPAETEDQRVLNLRESLRMTIYTWITRGLAERHKLIFLSQLTFNLMKRGILGEDNLVNDVNFQFLLRGPKKLGTDNPLPWLPPSSWDACQALADVESFEKFAENLVEAAPRFREWFNALAPENEKLPLEWSALDKEPFKKMMVVRCLRPDRMIAALGNFIRNTLPNGNAYADCDNTLSSLEVVDQTLGDSSSITPLYFILSPGANVVGTLDKLADKYGFIKGESYFNISMGQGQDIVAMQCLENAHRNGCWVILNNVHLMPRWLVELEKKLDEYAGEGSHQKMRLFLTSDPSNSIPIGILNRSIKITQEPPAGLKANLKRAWANFPRQDIEDADSKTKSILFGLCFFHAVLMERKLFGPMGFNMMYPFSVGDLRDSAAVLNNYLENSGGGKIPWQDLKYIFGEIMYGGHIVNDFDRLLANTYLDFYMKEELLDEQEMFPFAEDEKGVSFMSPAPTTYDKYIEHIDQTMGAETPIAFGLHPNAEIDFRTTQSDTMFKTLMELQPRDGGSGDNVATPQQIAEEKAQNILDTFGEKKFDTEDLIRSIDDMGPYQNVFIQEMDVMNVLLAEIVRSLLELKLGFAGELTMSEKMDALMMALYMDKVPASWSRWAWPSLRALTPWLSNFMARLQQLEEWSNNPADIPKVTWLSGLYNPQSFLTAICQVTAQKDKEELDKLVTQTDIQTKMNAEEIDSSPKDGRGAYIHGLSLQGARWDPQSKSVEKSKPKEMFCPMPVILVRGVKADKVDSAAYQCPCYKTEQRGPTFVFCAQLKTKSPPARWVLAGVGLILDVSS